jgi:hypothetical protein
VADVCLGEVGVQDRDARTRRHVTAALGRLRTGELVHYQIIIIIQISQKFLHNGVMNLQNL